MRLAPTHLKGSPDRRTDGEGVSLWFSSVDSFFRRHFVEQHYCLQNIGLSAAIWSNEHGKAGIEVNRGFDAGSIALDHNLFQHWFPLANANSTIESTIRRAVLS